MQPRKLIAHGPSSLTIALPHKWVKKHSLRKGDTIHVNEETNGLLITAGPTEQKRELSVNLTSHDWPSIISILTSVYRRGYDEVIVQYETQKEYQNISLAVRSLLGYAITENRKGRCHIKCLPSELEQDFQTLFRRVFLILLQQLEDLQDILMDQQALKTFYHRDADVNAIVNLAIRMINKGYIQDHFEELHLFHALLMLEECGDDMARFTIEASAYKDAKKMKAHVHECNKMMRMLYDAYFQKDGSIVDFYKQYYLYWPDAKKSSAPVYDLFSDARDKPVFYLRSIVEKIVQLAEILLLQNEERKK